MTAVAPPATTAPPRHVRRPRMRRPAHEPEPVVAVPAPAGPVPPPGQAPAGRATLPDAARDRSPSDARPDGPLRAPRPEDDVRPRAAATVRAMVEVLAGRRAPAHLAGLARPEVVRYLTASRATRQAGPVAPARVHVSRPGRDAAEIVAVCRFGSRFRALAIRMDREPAEHGRAWCATAVRLL